LNDYVIYGNWAPLVGLCIYVCVCGYAPVFGPAVIGFPGQSIKRFGLAPVMLIVYYRFMWKSVRNQMYDMKRLVCTLLKRRTS
jgi:hypothetical protein